MEKYIINGSLHQYTRLEAGDKEKASEIKDSLVVAIIDKELDDRFVSLYEMIHSLLCNGNRVVLVGITDDNKSFTPIASLLVQYRAYDIYTVTMKSVVSDEWVTKVTSRKADLNEVQNYLGGDLVSYSDLTSLLIGIENIIEEGNLESLKDFVEKYMPTLETLSNTLNHMKKVCDSTNTEELQALIAEYKSKLESVLSDADRKVKMIEELREDNQKFQSDVAELRETCSDLKSKLEEAEMAESSGGVVKTYNTLQVGSINCKVKNIIYFKEISYVPYVNSLVLQLFNVIKTKRKCRIKLLIYDTQTEFYQAYNPLRVVDGREYIANKSDLLKKVEQFVVSEPNPTILTDILTSDFEVVIIYDRMRGVKDLIAGNLITKFFILNSNTEYINYKAKLNIIDTSNIITRPGALKDKTLDIPFIDGYSGATPGAKITKYAKLATSHKEPLILTICKKARIEV